MDPYLLDNAVWTSLTGPQAPLAEVFGLARKFASEVSPFGAIANHNDPRCWRDMAHLIGAGGTIVFTGKQINVPED